MVDEQQKGRRSEPPVKMVIVYGLENSKKKYLSVVEGKSMDDLITSSKRNPIIPNKYTIFDIGIGESLIKSYAKHYKITKITKL